MLLLMAGDGGSIVENVLKVCKNALLEQRDVGITVNNMVISGTFSAQIHCACFVSLKESLSSKWFIRHLPCIHSMSNSLKIFTATVICRRENCKFAVSEKCVRFCAS